jgi:predicted DCC family thiol-disulfide oxidoreductase YuxK
MKVRILYDGACPFCADYVRYQELRSAVDEVELVDARAHPGVLAELGVAPRDLEDGMVVEADGRRYHGADAVHFLSRASKRPARWWVRWVAGLSRSRGGAAWLYPLLKTGRRVALTLLGIGRFPR